MSGTWYFLDRSGQVGPLSLEELRAALATCSYTREVLVRREGLEVWKRAGDVPELAGTAVELPPVTHEAPCASTSPERGSRNSDEGVTPAQPDRFSNPIAKNWRGEYPLWVSYWIFGFLGNVVVFAIPFLADELFRPSAGYNPRLAFAAVITVWLGVLAIATWQIVGVWRSAGRRMFERARLGKYAVWAGLAKIAVILALIRLVVDFWNTGIPQIAELSRVAFMNDPDLPAYSIRIMRNGTEVEISGGFKYGLTDDFLQVVGASRQIRVVHLNSRGGRIGEAERLSKEIRSRNLVTYTSSQCLSACALAFAGGRERWILNGAVLGFHRPAFPGMNDQGIDDSVRSQKEIFAAADFDPEFVARAMATPNKEMWTPSSSELLRARVITSVSDGSDFALSGLGPDVTREGVATMAMKTWPVLVTMKERFPADYDSIINICFNGFTSGQTGAEINSAATSKLASLIAVYRPLADDDVLVDLGRLLAEQYAEIGARSPARCFFYVSGKGGPIDVRSDLPDALVDRENVVGQRILATATRRPSLDIQLAVAAGKKVVANLISRGFSQEKISLLSGQNVAPERYADYCEVTVASFQEITKLDSADASLLMRQVMGGK